ncbi:MULTISPECIES: DUF2589 domain-containing protein [Oscillospiraceae]|uniref:Uncharacterized protein DUF2589 n=1 Tax=Harryflintia acetispora TaxID=1849041 RepID=A0A9X8Y9N5_9FIRM|nr:MULTISPECIES: DUF2589 domain-containing protein [Oscillospiraceae]RGB68795.1 DUF2589 domain-containing protein [Harryflintia acetispora]TCL45384.1 uncharacterized protein DUF2589 [Harryflintia acetispora]
MFEKWKKSPLKGKGGTLETTLADIVRGIQYCVNSASEIVDRQYVAQLDQYFENGRPLVYPVELPDGSRMELPLFTLMNHSALALDKMKVSMTVGVDEVNTKSTDVPIANNENFKLERASFQVRMGAPAKKNGGQGVRLEMTFKAGEQPEAVARLAEQLCNGIKLYAGPPESAE